MQCKISKTVDPNCSAANPAFVFRRNLKPHVKIDGRDEFKLDNPRLRKIILLANRFHGANTGTKRLRSNVTHEGMFYYF